MPQTLPIFDGHNDFLYRLLHEPANREAMWLAGDGKGHLDLPRIKQGQFAGGFFAIYIPSPATADTPDYMALMDKPPYDLPLPALISDTIAQPIALTMAGHLLWMERAAKGAFKICRTTAELRDCLARGVISGIMHMEGARCGRVPRCSAMACHSVFRATPILAKA